MERIEYFEYAEEDIPPRVKYFGYVDEDIRPIITPTRLVRSTLLSAVLVNKAWAAEAIRILWKSTPVIALAAIKDRDRRQFYAFRVRKLEVCHYESETRATWAAECSTLRDLELPLLKFIDIDEEREFSTFDLRLCVECCIRPSLEVVQYTGSVLDSHILHLLRTHCPNLNKIVVLVYVFESVSALAELIDSCKSLRSIILYGSVDEESFAFVEAELGTGDSRVHADVHEQLLRSLACCNGLEEMKVHEFLEYPVFCRVLRSTEQPFKDLRYLSFALQLDAKSASLLVPKLNPLSLTALHLDIRIDGMDSTSGMMPEIGLRLVNLQRLSLEYGNEEDMPFHPNDMIPLQNLKRLRSLQISYLRFLPKLTDEVFISMVENWPELEVLQLDLSGGSALSTTSLTSLGKLCPRLKDCQIIGSYDLTDWQNIPRPIFPQLQRLIIHGSVDAHGFLDREGESQ